MVPGAPGSAVRGEASAGRQMTPVLRAMAVVAFLSAALSLCYIPWSRRWSENQVSMARMKPEEKVSVEEHRRGPFEDTVWSWAWSSPPEPKKKGVELEPDVASGDFSYVDFTDLKISPAVGFIAAETGTLVTIGVAGLAFSGFRFRHCPKCGAALR